MKAHIKTEHHHFSCFFSPDIISPLSSSTCACLPFAVMFSRNLKNTVVVSVGFLFLFTAYAALQNLQVGVKPQNENFQFIVLKTLKAQVVMKKCSPSICQKIPV